MEYDVFISYSRKDAVEVEKLCHEFTTNHITFFRDTREISGGSQFFNDIATAILNSKIFLYVGSRNSYTSKYTPKEVSFAIAEKRYIMPYLIDESSLPQHLSLAFADLNVRKKRDGHTARTIISDIRAYLQKGNSTYMDGQGRKENTKVNQNGKTLKAVVNKNARNFTNKRYESFKIANWEDLIEQLFDFLFGSQMRSNITVSIINLIGMIFFCVYNSINIQIYKWLSIGSYCIVGFCVFVKLMNEDSTIKAVLHLVLQIMIAIVSLLLCIAIRDSCI